MKKNRNVNLDKWDSVCITLKDRTIIIREEEFAGWTYIKQRKTRLYEVWMEEGDYSDVELLGTMEAENFQEACDFIGNSYDGYIQGEQILCGCKLYDNEKDARKGFG